MPLQVLCQLQCQLPVGDRRGDRGGLQSAACPAPDLIPRSHPHWAPKGRAEADPSSCPALPCPLPHSALPLLGCPAIFHPFHNCKAGAPRQEPCLTGPPRPASSLPLQRVRVRGEACGRAGACPCPCPRLCPRRGRKLGRCVCCWKCAFVNTPGEVWLALDHSLRTQLYADLTG